MADDPFIGTLLATAEADPQVLGLVLCGSSAEPERRDQWSDHDFLLITADGTPERYRTDLAWLPDVDDIAWSFRETAHGLKVLYRGGLIIEFAVFDRAEFASCALNHYAVVLDRGGIDATASDVRNRSLTVPPLDRLGEFRNFLALVYIGTGRARRGERLSASAFVRTHATEDLMRVIRDVLPAERSVKLDALDVWRRFETADPQLATELDRALSRDVTDVGRALLDVADDWLPRHWPEYPHADTAIVRSLLGW